MLPRRPVIWALLAGIAALGRPAAAPGQEQPAALPLRDAREMVVVDAWHGLSAISPSRTTYTLRRSADGSFAGTVQITMGAGFVRRDTSFAVRLPRAAADSVLRVLSEVPLREGAYRPTLTHTDDYPSITAELTVGDSVIGFHTSSQGAAHVPWRVTAGGRRYVSASEAIWPALGPVLDLGRREERALAQAARADPEARCNHDLYGDRLPAQRPRYAAGEAWFRRDSVITAQGREYRKYALPRIVGLQEISPYATYRGVTLFQELGTEGRPEILYVPVRASCEVQPYVLQPER